MFLKDSCCCQVLYAASLDAPDFTFASDSSDAATSILWLRKTATQDRIQNLPPWAPGMLNWVGLVILS